MKIENIEKDLIMFIASLDLYSKVTFLNVNKLFSDFFVAGILVFSSSSGEVTSIPHYGERIFSPRAFSFSKVKQQLQHYK